MQTDSLHVQELKTLTKLHHILSYFVDKMYQKLQYSGLIQKTIHQTPVQFCSDMRQKDRVSSAFYSPEFTTSAPPSCRTTPTSFEEAVTGLFPIHAIIRHRGRLCDELDCPHTVLIKNSVESE